jgi:hypothetical protein
MIDFGGAFSALRGFSENHVTLKRALANAECGGASGRLRAEGVSGERGAAERGGASDQLRARGRGARRRAACPIRYPAVSATAPTATTAWAAHKGRAARKAHPPSCLAV